MTAAVMTTPVPPRPPRKPVDPGDLAATVNLAGPEAEVRRRIADVIRRALLDATRLVQYTRACRHCFKSFFVGGRPVVDGHRTDAIYCSDSCRVAAWRSRNVGA
jgi:hypothetical protein